MSRNDGEVDRDGGASGGKKKWLVITDIDGTIFDYVLYENIKNSANERGERVDWRKEGRKLGIDDSRKTLEELSKYSEMVYLTARVGDAAAERGNLRDATFEWLRYMNYPEGLVVMRRAVSDGRIESNYTYKNNAILHLLSGERYENANYMWVRPRREERNFEESGMAGVMDMERYKGENFEIVVGFGNETHDIWAYIENGVVPLIYTGEGNPSAGEVLDHIRQNRMEGVVYTFDSWSKVPEILEELGGQRYMEWKRKASDLLKRFAHESRTADG